MIAMSCILHNFLRTSPIGRSEWLIPGSEDIVVRDERAGMLQHRSKSGTIKSRRAYRGNLVQITLEHEAESVEIQVVEVVVERVLTVAVVNTGGNYLACRARTSPVQFPKIRATRMM
jgi:hypothetical protein